MTADKKFKGSYKYPYIYSTIYLFYDMLLMSWCIQLKKIKKVQTE